MRIAVIGYGAVGRATASLLLARGDEVRVVQRRQPAALAARTTFLAADVEDHDEMLRACDDVDAVVCCIGLPYRASLWERVWPRAVANLLDGCAASRARFVFADNLYMYGPQTQPLTENLPLTTYGRKPRVRAQITELWREARDAGRVRAVAVRASDFYGPDVPTSVLSTYGVARLVAKQAALVPYSPDHPHDFTYVPDFARALVTLLDAPDDAYGQPGTCPTRRHERCARSSSWGRRAPACVHAVRVLPRFARGILGVFSTELAELGEMQFQWDRPYLVDTSKFTARFWSDATSFENGLDATSAFYRGAAGRRIAA